MPSPLALPDAATLAGAAAVALNASWPVLRSRRRILALQVVASLLFGLHYSLLGARTGAAMCLAGAAQGLAMALLRGHAARLGAFGAAVAAGLTVTVATWSGLASLCAQGGQLLSALGRLRRSAQSIRWCFLAAEGFWVSHNLLVGSRWGLTSDVLAVSMLAIGLWRGHAARRPGVVRRGAGTAAA